MTQNGHDLANNSDAYEELKPLGERRLTGVWLRRGTGSTEEERYYEFASSTPIAQISKLRQKPYGYQRDAQVTNLLEKSAVLGLHALGDMVLDAPCVNRKGRYDAEEEGAGRCLQLISLDTRSKPEGTPDINTLLDRWSQADAFCLQARIEEEKYGIDATAHLDGEFKQREQERREVEMESAKLPAAENMLFWCRLRQYKIMREQAYDVAMGYPTADYTQVKRQLAAGHDIHDLIMQMPWPFHEAYHLVMGSMMDGHHGYVTTRTDIPQRTDIDDPTPYRQHKEDLFRRQEGICNGCKAKFPIWGFEVDHIVPQSRGGTDHPDNLQLLCAYCNRTKGDRGQEYLMARLRMRGII